MSTWLKTLMSVLILVPRANVVLLRILMSLQALVCLRVLGFSAGIGVDNVRKTTVVDMSYRRRSSYSYEYFLQVPISLKVVTISCRCRCILQVTGSPTPADVFPCKSLCFLLMLCLTDAGICYRCCIS